MLILVVCLFWNVYGGGAPAPNNGGSITVNVDVPIWTDTPPSPPPSAHRKPRTTSTDNNNYNSVSSSSTPPNTNVVRVPIWTDITQTAPTAYAPDFSSRQQPQVPVGVMPNSPVSSSSNVIPVPIWTDQPQQQPQQMPNPVQRVPPPQPPPASRVPVGVMPNNPVSVPNGVNPSLVNAVPIWTDQPPPPSPSTYQQMPNPVQRVPLPQPPPALPPSPYSSSYPRPPQSPPDYSSSYPVPPSPSVRIPAPVPPPFIPVPVTVVIPPISPTPSFFPPPLSPTLFFPPISPTPFFPVTLPQPTPVVAAPTPSWAFVPVPTPVWITSQPSRSTRPTQVPSPVARPTRARKTPTSPAPTFPAVNQNVPHAVIYSVEPPSVCATVRRNLVITGEGFVSNPANYSCNFVPSCMDNPDWQDSNGYVCGDYQGVQCTAEALANCRVSCRAKCPTVGCQDVAQCSTLAAQGLCTTDPNRMMLSCPVTCGYCGMYPAFVLNDTQLACQAPPLGGQGFVAVQVLRDRLAVVGALQVQSYDCQNNQTSDKPAISLRDLAAMVARPVSGKWGPNDSSMSMQFYVANIGLLDLSGPVQLFISSQNNPPIAGRRLLDVQSVWCAPALSVGTIVACSITRYITWAEKNAGVLTTSVWSEATYQDATVNSTLYTFQTSMTTPEPTTAPGTQQRAQAAQGAKATAACAWNENPSCVPWYGWLILVLLLLLLLLCCIGLCCAWKRNRETNKKESKNSYVYRRPRPEASPPVKHSASVPQSRSGPQEEAHGPDADPQARLAYKTMQDSGTIVEPEPPAVRLVFNTGSGPFEVRGPESEEPSHFVFEERASLNSVPGTPTHGRRSVSVSQHRDRRDEPGHVVFGEAT